MMTDDELITVLRAALAGDGPAPAQVPASAVAAAEAAFGWVSTGDLLAELVFDSADPTSLVPTRRRGAAAARQLSYRSDGLDIECEVTADGLLGQVEPAGHVRLELLGHAGEPVPLDLDDEGRFLSERVPPGPVCIRCRRPGRPDVLTPWLLP